MSPLPSGAAGNEAHDNFKGSLESSVGDGALMAAASVRYGEGRRVHPLLVRSPPPGFSSNDSIAYRRMDTHVVESPSMDENAATQIGMAQTRHYFDGVDQRPKVSANEATASPGIANSDMDTRWLALAHPVAVGSVPSTHTTEPTSPSLSASPSVSVSGVDALLRSDAGHGLVDAVDALNSERKPITGATTGISGEADFVERHLHEKEQLDGVGMFGAHENRYLRDDHGNASDAHEFRQYQGEQIPAAKDVPHGNVADSFSKSAIENGMDNYARQSRHTASRLIGSVSGRSGSVAPSIGSPLPAVAGGHREAVGISAASVDPMSFLFADPSQLPASSGIFGAIGPQRNIANGIGVTVEEPHDTKERDAMIHPCAIGPESGGGSALATVHPPSRGVRRGVSDEDLGHVSAIGPTRPYAATLGPATGIRGSEGGRASAPPEMCEKSSKSFRDSERRDQKNVLQSHEETHVLGHNGMGLLLEASQQGWSPAFEATTVAANSHSGESGYPEASSHVQVSTGDSLEFMLLRHKLGNTPSPSPEVRQLEIANQYRGRQALEDAADRELRPFLWDVAESTGTSPGIFGRTPSPGTSSPHPSRCLVVLRCSRLFIPDVRSTFEALGCVLSFRSEFCRSRGVIFVEYSDLRSARFAALELPTALQRLVAPSPSSSGKGRNSSVEIRYCIALDSWGDHDESVLVLENLPPEVEERYVDSILSSFGDVRTVRLVGMSVRSEGEKLSLGLVEFYDIQDARQALVELSTSKPFGPEVAVRFAPRNEVQQRHGENLLEVISRWKQSDAASTEGRNPRLDSFQVRANAGYAKRLSSGSGVEVVPSLSSAVSSTVALFGNVTMSDDSKPQAPAPSTVSDQGAVSRPPTGSNEGEGAASQTSLQQGDGEQTPPQAPSQLGSTHARPYTHLVVGPDGQYNYVVMGGVPESVSPPIQSQQHPSSGPMHASAQPQHPMILPPGRFISSMQHPYPPSQDHGMYWIPPHGAHLAGHAVAGAPPYVDPRQPYSPVLPVYTPVVPMGMHGHQTEAGAPGMMGSLVPGIHGHGIGRQPDSTSHLPRAPAGSPNEEDSSQLSLDLDAIRNGRDTRTSLMVRNIPNKYTQQMLLSEFAECGNGPDKIDFFYLPIDFKNKCNRGYAFVNFTSFRDILPFHQQYNGRRWKVFNSEKICSITYARIQGKAAMLKRFQNSSLMEKDDEYRPLVFVSHGPDKGKREEFPPSSHGSSSSASMSPNSGEA